MKRWCQTGDEEGERIRNRELIIEGETVLFPPLAEEPSSHFFFFFSFYTQRLRHTHTHTLAWHTV